MAFSWKCETIVYFLIKTISFWESSWFISMINASFLFPLCKLLLSCLRSDDNFFIAKINTFRMFNKCLIHNNLSDANKYLWLVMIRFSESFCWQYFVVIIVGLSFKKGDFFLIKSSIYNIKWNHSFGRYFANRAELCLWLPDFEHLGMLCNKLIKLSLTVLWSLFSF